MKTHLNRKVFLVVFFLSFLLISAVYADKGEIKYPVKELGSCGSQEECKTYCGAPENFSSCSDFAGKNNLRGEDERSKFEAVQADGGPGNCAANSKNPMESCRKFCDDTANMKECVNYARAKGLMDEAEMAEAEKVISALERGIQLPKGCKNKESCQRICEAPADMTIARECFDFAEAAGLLPPGVDREQAEKVFQAIESGRAPFKSPKDFEKCENPPNEEIMQKCMDFALENGFMSPEDAEMVRKTGGKGPGGCRGKKQCEDFCRNNQEACVAFALEHDLISPEEKAQMEEGLGKFRESLSGAPDEVKNCLEGAIGADDLEKISSGQKFLTGETGRKAEECFKRQQEGNSAFPPEIKSCIISKIGESGFEQLTQKGPTPEMDEQMRSCFEINKEEGEMRPPERREYEGERPEEYEGQMPPEYQGQMPPEAYERSEDNIPSAPESALPRENLLPNPLPLFKLLFK